MNTFSAFLLVGTVLVTDASVCERRPSGKLDADTNARPVLAMRTERKKEKPPAPTPAPQNPDRGGKLTPPAHLLM